MEPARLASKSRALGAALLLALTPFASACGASDSAAHEAEPARKERAALGLFTTLPLLWGENADFGAMLDNSAAPDPARVAIEAHYRLEPLDLLDEAALAGLDRLLLVQPRILSGGENVALDNWVRAGGHALVFADPLLTRHTIFPIGDKRRPQDIALLSPILARWGLELVEPEEGRQRRSAAVLGQEVALDHAGTLALKAHDAPAECTLESDALVARCVVGKGRVTVVADAAMFDELESGSPASDALNRLVRAGLGD